MKSSPAARPAWPRRQELSPRQGSADAHTSQVHRSHLTLASISGKLTSHRVPLRAKVVWPERRGPRGHWTAVRRQRTRLQGLVIFRAHESRTTSFRLAFRGTRIFRPSVSATAMVKMAH